MDAQVKMDMRLGINMDSYTDLDYEGKVEMSKHIDGGQGKLIITLTVSPDGEGDKAKRKEQT